jgi:type II secretory pathway pseudopilin PulG
MVSFFTRLFKVAKPNIRERGFSLLESVFSMQLIGIAALGVAQAFSFNIKMNNVTEQKSAASFACQQVLEEIRTSPINDLPMSGADEEIAVQIDKKIFLVELSYCNNPDLCSNSMRHLRASVFYKGNKIHEVETVFSKLN